MWKSSSEVRSARSRQIGQISKKGCPLSNFLRPKWATEGIMSRLCVSAVTVYTWFVLVNEMCLMLHASWRSALTVVSLHRCVGMP